MCIWPSFTKNLVPGRAQKSSGSGLLISKSSGSGLFGFPTKSNLRVRVQAFGFIGFFGFKFAVFIAFLWDNFFSENTNFRLFCFQSKKYFTSFDYWQEIVAFLKQNQNLWGKIPKFHIKMTNFHVKFCHFWVIWCSSGTRGFEVRVRVCSGFTFSWIFGFGFIGFQLQSSGSRVFGYPTQH